MFWNLYISTNSSVTCKRRNTECEVLHKELTVPILFHESYASIPGEEYEIIVDNIFIFLSAQHYFQHVEFAI
jgi:hypothetical protein